jgi:hypothetical protein
MFPRPTTLIRRRASRGLTSITFLAVAFPAVASRVYRPGTSAANRP